MAVAVDTILAFQRGKCCLPRVYETQEPIAFSMASPHVAGVAALIVGAGIKKPDAVEEILMGTARRPKGSATAGAHLYLSETCNPIWARPDVRVERARLVPSIPT